jgi:hypothetical protein
LTDYNSQPYLINNSICFNKAFSQGGGFYSTGSSNPLVSGSIIWGNSRDQIFLSGGEISVNNSDVQSGWPGIGNIDQYPAFVDTVHDDYRLLWGSPCIDSGNPDSLDPDGTRSDMGAFYFDQSVPVHVLITPHRIPYLIPATGGSMDFTLRLNNWTTTPHTVSIWCDVILPDSTFYGPLIGPVTVTVPAGAMIARMRTQSVPASAPLGVYHYNANAVVGADTSRDRFMFGKLGSGGLNRGADSWSSTGEDFGEFIASTSGSGTTPTTVISPNPFNPSTVISYELRAASFVSLKIYDTAGRIVATLVDGWRDAGEHQVTFDASNLPSGVYLYRLQAGDWNATGKMVLLK